MRAGLLAQVIAEEGDEAADKARPGLLATARAALTGKKDAETRILQQAAKRGGVVSPVLVATYTEYSLDEAKRALDHLVDTGHAELRVAKKTGEMVYTIPGLLTDQTRDDLEPVP